MRRLRERKDGQNGWNDRIYRLAGYVVRSVGVVFFAFLLIYAARYTAFVLPGGREYPLTLHDSLWKNLLAVLLVLLAAVLLLLCEKRLTTLWQYRISNLAVLLAVCWVLGAGFWWVQSAVRVPLGDQAFVYGGASYFLEGEYSFLAPPGGYLAMYPHQLGLVALMEGLFRVTGPFNFHAFEIVCVLFAGGSVLAGALLLRETTQSMAAAVCYSVMMVFCLPLVFYTSWAYGDVPSLFFLLMAAWMLLRFQKSLHWGWLSGEVAMTTLAMLNRKNSAIFVVALCLVTLVVFLKKKSPRLLLAAALSIAVPYLAYQGVYLMYELRSGYEKASGIPVVAWVAMGLHETEGVCGWYDDSAKQLYYEQGMDAELAKHAAWNDASERLAALWKNPSDAARFFKEKLLSQWNTPLYQSLYFNTMYLEEYAPEEGSLVARLSTVNYGTVLSLCDRLQFVIYLGFVLYFLLGMRKDADLLTALLPVTVIGGVCFSLLWEAKARYSFPYYVMMFSYAAVGYVSLAQQILGAIIGKRKKNTEDNIIEFRKIA